MCNCKSGMLAAAELQAEAADARAGDKSTKAAPIRHERRPKRCEPTLHTSQQ